MLILVLIPTCTPYYMNTLLLPKGSPESPQWGYYPLLVSVISLKNRLLRMPSSCCMVERPRIYKVQGTIDLEILANPGKSGVICKGGGSEIREIGVARFALSILRTESRHVVVIHTIACGICTIVDPPFSMRSHVAGKRLYV